MLKLIGIFYCGLIFCGCNAVKSNITFDAKNSDYLYGEGSSTSFELAKQNAIKDLSTNLQVSVKYSSINSIKQTNDSLSINNSDITFLESQIKDLPAIEIDKKVYKNNIYSVRVRAEKSLIQSQIFNRLQTNMQTLDSMLHTCHSPQFQQYKHFKRIFKEYYNDLQLYQVLTRNMNFNNNITQKYRQIVDSLPTYSVFFENLNIQNGLMLQNIINGELSKFMQINNKAKKQAQIIFLTSNTLVLRLNFYDCNNQLETSLEINTYMPLQELKETSKQSRLGAIIYKAIQNTY